jgi:hypothetical protein
MKTLLRRSCLLLVFLGGLPVSCCQQTTRDYMFFKALSLDLADAAGNPLLSGSSTSAVELRATLLLQIDYIAQVPTSALFVSQAQALQCKDEGTKGLKAAVTDVVVTSTGLFNGRAAGQSLNAFVRCESATNPTPFPLAQLADSLNSKRWQRYQLGAPVVLHISPKPTDNASQQFQVRVRVAGGQDLTQRTPAISWN